MISLEKGCVSIEYKRTMQSAVPEFKLSFVLAYLQGLIAGEEAEDDLYCEALYQKYLQDPEREIEYSLEECKKEWGLT